LRLEIHGLLEPLIKRLGYELWGCEYLPQGRYSMLRIYIDKQGGVSIDDCELVSKEVSALLDVEDPIQGNYSLEISSPGIPKPLFSKEQYGRYLGCHVNLKLRQPVNGSRKLTAKIVAVGPTTVELAIGDVTSNVEFSEILKANLIGE
jgi:ribosome maturation factor RimP